MNGIDISSWQSGIDLSRVEADFVICKATQGTYYKNPDFERAFAQGLSLGKKMGIYHYAAGSDAVSEAEYFLAQIEPHIGQAILCLDWEKAQNAAYGTDDEAWCRTFMEHVREKTGVTMFLYISAGLLGDFPTLTKEFPLWAAQYANFDKLFAYAETPWNEGAYRCAIRQYTSRLCLHGWSGRLDGNKAYITAAEWDAYAAGENKSEGETVSISSVAEEVIDGKWGNGAERREKLGAYFYDLVQKEVNRRMGVSA